jgi:phosphoribosylformylglycinamidine cyclo-ligase
MEVDIKPTDVIVGFSSYGKATYEKTYNAGMGSNGLTSGRHDLLKHDYYTKYPESFDVNTNEEYIYSGIFSLTDNLNGTEVNIGQALLSPTRTYAPILNQIFKNNDLKKAIHGIIHCTGGAQTKVLKFLDKPLHIIKDNLLPIPPLFQIIQSTTETSMKEMFEVFNMGHRLEIYCDKEIAQELIDISSQFNIEAKVIGRCEEASEKSLTINDITY